MSVKAVTQFFQKLGEDATLQGEIVALAARNGFDFTTDELSRRMGADDLGLNDADLDRVVGGVAKKKPAKKSTLTTEIP